MTVRPRIGRGAARAGGRADGGRRRLQVLIARSSASHTGGGRRPPARLLRFISTLLHANRAIGSHLAPPCGLLAGDAPSLRHDSAAGVSVPGERSVHMRGVVTISCSKLNTFRRIFGPPFTIAEGYWSPFANSANGWSNAVHLTAHAVTAATMATASLPCGSTQAPADPHAHPRRQGGWYGQRRPY
jgi:hypothetical protein